MKKKLTIEAKAACGQRLAEILGIAEVKGRYITEWGTKTALGIYETVDRIITDWNEYGKQEGTI